MYMDRERNLPSSTRCVTESNRLYRLNIAGREHYIVSSEKIANDLLRERGNIYSSREQLPAAAKLLGDDLRREIEQDEIFYSRF